MKKNNTIHSTVKIMEGVIISDSVVIGANTFIGAGVIISANGGTIEIGENTVIMEGAIIRSSKKFNCKIGNHVLVGPKATITGATVADSCFIATNGTIFHGSKLESGTVLAVNGIVQIATFCPENTYIPINHIAFGNPAKIYSPMEIGDFHTALKQIGFAKYVYDINTLGLSNSEIYQKMTSQFLSNLEQ